MTKILLVAEKTLTMEAIKEIGNTLLPDIEGRLIQDPLFVFPRYLYDICGENDIVVYVPDDGKGYYHYSKEEIAKVFKKHSNRRRSSISLFEEIINSQKGE